MLARFGLHPETEVDLTSYNGGAGGDRLGDRVTLAASLKLTLLWRSRGLARPEPNTRARSPLLHGRDVAGSAAEVAFRSEGAFLSGR
jgi:hypothetical protein